MNGHRTFALLEKLRLAQLRLASLALIVMMAVTLLDVFLRYLFNSPIRGSYDLVETMLVVFVFHGMSTAFLERRHIVIDLIDTFVHRAVVTVLIRLSDILTVLTIVMFAYAMITPAMQSYSYGEFKMELRIPIWYLWAAALTGIAGAILCAAGTLIVPVDSRHDDESV
jgi:TRAP-type C4-dicarboxylate transport system permease small subunit